MSAVTNEPPAPGEEPIEARIRRALGARSIVLVGLMGAGQSTVGRRLAQRLGLIFKDADIEIEAAAGLTLPDIFAIYGEPSFRDGEERVIGRLLRDRGVAVRIAACRERSTEGRLRLGT